MGNVATDAQIRKIVKSADHYLYRKEIGGYRLNTDFQELKFDMGRMFGFAYGEKENGAVFSHMAVMYANALYQRGFAKEGWKALRSLSDTALDFDTSHIYPGIPEYFRSDGRGMYHYLTGAASWYLFTMITEVFGVRGVFGNLLVHPNFWQNSSMKQELLLSLLLLQETVPCYLPKHRQKRLWFLSYRRCGLRQNSNRNRRRFPYYDLQRIY